MSLYEKTAHELSDLLRKGEISSVELTRSVLSRISEVEPQIQAYISVTGDIALEMAKAADEALRRGEAVSPLAGIPIAIKDNMCTKGVPTTCASRILGNFVPPYDATTVARLRAVRTVFVGKTNMDEFAMGSSTENSGFKKTFNPWDRERIPGGSSGGSAAAVAADMAILATGSDTGGSIRQPAACCGVVGLKPTYGLVSRYGLVAFASSLDQIGPITKDVEDAALLLNELAGHDPMDSTSAPYTPPDYRTFLNKEIRGMRVGLPKEYFGEGLDPEVRTAVEKAVSLLQELGASIVEVSLPHSPYAVATYYLCATAEASSNLARYDGVKYGLRVEADNVIDMFSRTRSAGFGPEVKRRIMLGTYALSAGYYDAYYLKALRVRTLIKKDFEEAFQLCDVIAGPTAPTPAFRIGEKTENPLEMYLSDIFTISVNLAGNCAISVPCGFSGEGLPIGLQFIAPAFEEGRLLQVAHTYEQATPWHLRKPPCGTSK
ncbi:MAG: Asp-tRNA(Asn)/Glu-tRNA(Gln) amidotransferase subunit GatA [Candidatus Sumerlaea chitinivorans]|nr:Asp-tRNA(Asn)/Glu-tRNA(Gln) amidotransferase subunit GatA [Candidatus Sumerlaea chitinivorans]